MRTGSGARSSTMPLHAHLAELRSRSLRAAAAIVLAAGIAFWASDSVLQLLRQPILELATSRNASLNYTTISGAFDLRVQIALVGAVILSTPVWMWQLFAFCRPGMTRRERRNVLGFTAAAVPLFVTGCTVGVLLFPNIVSVLTLFSAAEDSTILDAAAYFDFVTKLVIASGLAFVIPAVVVLLNRLGLVRARTLLRSWRVVLIGVVVFSALATPAADVSSMLLLAVPLTLLFAGAVGIAALHDRAADRQAAARPEPDPDTADHAMATLWS